MKDFLFSERGREYLLDEYVRQEKSTYAIAHQRDVYPNLVRRALIHHGIEARDKSAAQRAALKAGRHTHPTEGRRHSPEVRQRIGEGVSRARRENRGNRSC
jgi:hypothetical protein